MSARYALALCESCDGLGETQTESHCMDCPDCLGTGYAEPQKRILNLQSEISELWYEREAAKAAIKVLQRELAKARDKIEELVQTGLKQMDKERSLKRELSEAREDAANQRRLTDLALAHRDVIIAERETLAEALESMWPFIEEDDHPNCNTPAFNAAIAKYKAALAAVKGGNHE